MNAAVFSTSRVALDNNNVPVIGAHKDKTAENSHSSNKYQDRECLMGYAQVSA
jgi:hypothetical protein